MKPMFTVAELHQRYVEKAKSARATAAKAYRKGDRAKWQSFNSVARVYEMVAEDIGEAMNGAVVVFWPEKLVANTGGTKA